MRICFAGRLNVLASSMVRGSLALVIAAAFVSPLEAAPRNATGVGENVGNFRQALCPPRTYLVAMKNTVNFWLDAFTIYCAGVDSAGDWTTTASPAPQGSVVRGWGFDGNQIDVVIANTHMLACPLDTYVTGFNPGVATVTRQQNGATVTNQLPWHTMLQCRSRKSGAVKEQAYPAVQWGSDPTVNGRLLGWDGMSGDRSCRAHEVGVGAWAMVGDNIRKFGLICAPFSDVTSTINVKAVVAKPPSPATRAQQLQRPNAELSAASPVLVTGGQRLDPAAAAAGGGSLSLAVKELCRKDPALCR